ncbi:MAG: replicative DNA helicase [Lentisphaerae bacterium RIFOXYC12_FULL_60_16]|nr:MAG: replicative DNA helicase [Lentisphaerae bacterium RIFOXYC12_FULL_60_16]OGV74482.1 MAG: replicative DNA helicase [Lentisphaerae bacterium RIFOXYA12_FULL_60_10]OGV76039.1 MAG: replicative DNA helicase [Lentisphaerae bacterium RIFOXYB12_FULL_60_10]
MSPASVDPVPVSRGERVPPHSEDAERGVLGSILLDASRVMDLCIEGQLTAESFYLTPHRVLYEVVYEMSRRGDTIDALTVTERLRNLDRLDRVGGAAAVDQLIDSTPTSAHAEYYIDIVRQKHLLRSILSCVRDVEAECFRSPESADHILGQAEQSLLSIAESRHGLVGSWDQAIKDTMAHVEHVLNGGKVLSGIPTGFRNLDDIILGMRPGEMIVLAARPSMGKTSLAMNIVENVVLGKGDRTPRPVGVFSLEMSRESLALRMLCCHAGVSAFRLAKGFVSRANHGKLVQAVSVLSKAQICLDDTGGLDIMDLRARARRMMKKHQIQLIVVDYLQMLHAREAAAQGRQLETASISGNLKSLAKELKVPVLVLSQLSRAPEQRTGGQPGRPKLSDLRDSGAIEQDADVVCLMRRPRMYPEDDEHEDLTLAIVDVAKHRNGPTGEVRLNFDDEFTRFTDRAHGVDAAAAPPPEVVEEQMGMETT